MSQQEYYDAIRRDAERMMGYRIWFAVTGPLDQPIEDGEVGAAVRLVLGLRNDSIDDLVRSLQEHMCATIELAFSDPPDAPLPYGPVGELARRVHKLRALVPHPNEGLGSAAELDEELQKYDDLAEKFGLDRERAYQEISKVLEDHLSPRPSSMCSRDEYKELVDDIRQALFTGQKSVAKSRAQGAFLYLFKDPGPASLRKMVPQVTGDIPVPSDVVRAFLELLESVESRYDRRELLERATVCRNFINVLGMGVDPGFGVDPKDSAALQELRAAIDDHLSWDSNENEEKADYVARVRQVGYAISIMNRTLARMLVSHE